MRAKDTPVPVEKDREPLLDVPASAQRADGKDREPADCALRRMAVESQLQRTADHVDGKGRNRPKGGKASGKTADQEGKERVVEEEEEQ